MQINWIPVITRNFMPMDGSNFLSIWKGRICLTKYDEEENSFWICMDADRFTAIIGPERENKFTHWMPLPHNPFDDKELM